MSIDGPNFVEVRCGNQKLIEMYDSLGRLDVELVRCNWKGKSLKPSQTKTQKKQRRCGRVRRP